MENQAIEKRYLDRKLLFALLDRLFPDNYMVEVRCRSQRYRDGNMLTDDGCWKQEQRLKTLLTLPRKLTEVCVQY